MVVCHLFFRLWTSHSSSSSRAEMTYRLTDRQPDDRPRARRLTRPTISQALRLASGVGGPRAYLPASPSPPVSAWSQCSERPFDHDEPARRRASSSVGRPVLTSKVPKPTARVPAQRKRYSAVLCCTVLYNCKYVKRGPPRQRPLPVGGPSSKQPRNPPSIPRPRRGAVNCLPHSSSTHPHTRPASQPAIHPSIPPSIQPAIHFQSQHRWRPKEAAAPGPTSTSSPSRLLRLVSSSIPLTALASIASWHRVLLPESTRRPASKL